MMRMMSYSNSTTENKISSLAGEHGRMIIAERVHSRSEDLNKKIVQKPT